MFLKQYAWKLTIRRYRDNITQIICMYTFHVTLYQDVLIDIITGIFINNVLVKIIFYNQYISLSTLIKKMFTDNGKILKKSMRLEK